MTIKKRLLVMFSLTGLTGISAIFLPLIYDISPMEAACEGYGGFLDGAWKFGVPFLLSIFILGASLRWIISGSLSKVERWIAYILSILMACITLSIFCADPPSNPEQWIPTITVLTLAIGIFLVIRSIKNEKLRQFSPIMAMQTAYLGNCVFCLLAFYDDWDIGAYFAIVTAVLYIVHMIMITLNKCSTNNQEIDS